MPCARESALRGATAAGRPLQQPRSQRATTAAGGGADRGVGVGKRSTEAPSPLGVFAPTGFWLHPNIPGGPSPLARPLEGWQEVITVDAQRTWGATPARESPVNPGAAFVIPVLFGDLSCS